MSNNLGAIDRAIRIALGVVLISLVRFGPQTAWGYLGFVPLLTGVYGWCPLYALLRISTNRKPPSARPAT